MDGLGSDLWVRDWPWGSSSGEEEIGLWDGTGLRNLFWGSESTLLESSVPERFLVLPIFCIKNSIILIILDNYIIVDELVLGDFYADPFIREICANPEIRQLPSTPKEIWLNHLVFKENEEVLNFTCNGKLNGSNRLTIQLYTPETNYGNFIRQWFEVCK
jgi:hypothetical protein